MPLPPTCAGQEPGWTSLDAPFPTPPLSNPSPRPQCAFMTVPCTEVCTMGISVRAGYPVYQIYLKATEDSPTDNSPRWYSNYRSGSLPQGHLGTHATSILWLHQPLRPCHRKQLAEGNSQRGTGVKLDGPGLEVAHVALTHSPLAGTVCGLALPQRALRNKCREGKDRMGARFFTLGFNNCMLVTVNGD